MVRFYRAAGRGSRCHVGVDPNRAGPRATISPMTLSATDLALLTRAVDLAEAALAAGDEPFGSLLVDATGEVRFTDHNHVAGGDHTQHPEFAIARWAAEHLSPAERAAATVYTSGEHCPMCAAAHGWVGLGRIVVAATSEQLVGWLTGWDQPTAPVAALPVGVVVPGAVVDGPAPELSERVRQLHARSRGIDPA